MGMSMDAAKYSEDLRAVALELIRAARPGVQLPTNAERGPRFMYDDGILWRLESMTSEDDFVHDPIKGIMGALIDAAQSDYWYSHEKDYGYEGVEDAEDIEEWETDAC